MRTENVHSHEGSNANKTSHLALLNSKKRPAEQPIVKALINMESHNTDWRCKLKEDLLNDLMHVTLSRVTVKNVNPEPAIELWRDDVKITRRLVDAYWHHPRTKQAKTKYIDNISLLSFYY